MKIFALLLLTATILFFSGKQMTNQALQRSNERCSEGWKITGYFTPIEADYAADDAAEIRVQEMTGKLSFSSKFLRTVIVEGWGKTNAGWYLGYDHETQKWQKSDAPLDNKGNALKIGMIAADLSVLQLNSRVTIPALPGEWGKTVYAVTDIGMTEFGEVSVKNKHIDVYTGEGREAERQTFLITREDSNELVEVCAAD